jgi:hypothetical protein
MKLIASVFALLAGCIVGDATDDDADFVDPNPDGLTALATKPGINGSVCQASPFNCRFHAGTGQRVETPSGGISWHLTAGATLRDGNGNPLSLQLTTTGTFNYGQTRALAGAAHALMLGSDNKSAAWYPIDQIVDSATFRAQNGNVDAQNPDKGWLACYVIRESDDPVIGAKKVNKNSTSVDHDNVADYLPLVRANGKRSVNLIFSVPGFELGGSSDDHFLARQPDGSRTQFHRVVVPTDSGLPSISIPLYKFNSATRVGTERFLYGYITASDGVNRFGWIAQDAVEPGC